MSSHISRVEILPSGILAVIVAPSGTQLVHRLSVVPGDDLAAARAALDTSLASLHLVSGDAGCEPVDEAEWAALVMPVAAAMWTPAIVSAWTARLASASGSISGRQA